MKPLLFTVLTILQLAGVIMAAEPVPLKVDIVGHRGASFDAPENTLAAINLAWEQKADGVEFDIFLTKDGKIVAMHDKDTKRTAGTTKVVAESTLEELRALDVGSWKNPEYAGEKIPKLEELLITVRPGKRAYIEVKCGPEIVPELDRVLRATELKTAQTPIISFNADVIAAVKKLRPDLPAYWIVGLKKETNLETLIPKAKSIHADGLDLSANEFLTPEFARQIREAGLRLDVWTVNDAALAKRMIELGARGITTDKPGWLREELAKGASLVP